MYSIHLMTAHRDREGVYMLWAEGKVGADSRKEHKLR